MAPIPPWPKLHTSRLDQEQSFCLYVLLAVCAAGVVLFWMANAASHEFLRDLILWTLTLYVLFVQIPWFVFLQAIAAKKSRGKVVR